MIKYVDKICEYCGAEMIHVTTKKRFCHACAKIRQRESNRKSRKRGTYKDPLWREQSAVMPPEERYKNRLQRLTDDYRYGARHSVNVAVIRQIKNIGKKLGYTGLRIIDDIEQAKAEAQSGNKCYHATPEEIKEMLGE